MAKKRKDSEKLNEGVKAFETDSHKLSSLHLADQFHVISDEEMKNIKVGITPPAEDNAILPKKNDRHGTDADYESIY